MFGFSKSFIICLVIALIFGYKVGWKTGLSIIGIYAVIKFIWKIMT